MKSGLNEAEASHSELTDASLIAWVFKLVVALATIMSAIWLLGYARSIAPFAWDHLRDGEFDFLTFPGIKIYRLVDQNTGAVSRHLDFFNTADGPTGIEYTEQYFPCWPVSLVALATFLGGGLFLLMGGRRSEQTKSR